MGGTVRRGATAVAAALALLATVAPAASAETYRVVFVLVTFADDATTRQGPHLYTLDELRRAGAEMTEYFRLLSNGNFDLRTTVAEAPGLAARDTYRTGTSMLNAAADSAAAAGHRAALNDVDGVYYLLRGYRGGHCNAYYGRHRVTSQINRLVGVMAVQQGCRGRGGPAPGPNPSPVDWSGFEQEVGHAVQELHGRYVGHPAGYGDGYNMMDSCYPCGEGVFDLSGPPIVGGNLSAFPGWLPPAKVETIVPTLGARTVTLAPVSADPASTTQRQGLKVPLSDINVPVSATERWTASRYYLAQLHRRVRAFAYGPPGSPRLADEGIQIHEVRESRDPPVQVQMPCMQEAPELRCEGQPGATHTWDDCRAEERAGRSQPYCWPFRLWHPGQTFEGVAGVGLTVGSPTPAGDLPVTVGRSLFLRRADPYIIPENTPPMRTAETVDLWVDSSCNGYEFRRLGRYWLPSNPGALRYGRRSAPTPAGRTVIANGDDPCGDHENRVYANVRNAGDLVADDVVVRFFVGTHNEANPERPDWREIGRRTVDVPARSAVKTYVNWTPPGTWPLYLNIEQIRVVIEPSDSSVSTNTTAQERIVHVEGQPAPDLERVRRWSQVLIDVPPTPPGDPPPFYQLRASTVGPGDLTVDPVSIGGAPGSLRVPLEADPTTGVQPGRLHVANVFLDRLHTDVNERISPTWSAPAVHGDLETVGQLALMHHVVRPSRLSIRSRARGRNLLAISGRLRPARRTVLAVDLVRGSGRRARRVLTRLVRTNRRGRFALRVRRPGVARLRARAIFQGDRTAGHAIAGPGARIGLPPLPLSLAQVPPAVPLPQPFAPGGSFTGSQLSLSCPPGSQDGVVAVSGTLAPAAERTITLTYRAPDGTQLIRTVGTDPNGAYADRIEGATAGEWTVHASWRGDPFRLPASSAPCTTNVSTPPPPDLVIEDLTPEGVTVRNQGNGPAGEFELTVTQGDGKYTETFTIPGLGAGESARRDTTCEGGVVRAVADSKSQVAESDEGNNETVTQYGCPPP